MVTVLCVSHSCRSKSKSLTQLLHATGEEFPLDKTLHKGSANILSVSQPTQVTDIEVSPNTIMLCFYNHIHVALSEAGVCDNEVSDESH